MIVHGITPILNVRSIPRVWSGSITGVAAARLDVQRLGDDRGRDEKRRGPGELPPRSGAGGGRSSCRARSSSRQMLREPGEGRGRECIELRVGSLGGNGRRARPGGGERGTSQYQPAADR